MDVNFNDVYWRRNLFKQAVIFMTPAQESRLDRLENHFKTYKTDVSDIKDSVKEIRMLLGGTALNGNKGFVNLMQTIEERVDALEKKIDGNTKDIDNTKFWGRFASVILGSSIALIIKTLFEK